MGRSGFSVSLAHPFDPLCLSRTKTQSNAMMSSQPLSWEQNLCVAQEQQNNLCVALTPKHIGSKSFRAGVWLLSFINLSFVHPSRVYFPLSGQWEALILFVSWRDSWFTPEVFACVGCKVTAEFINSQHAYSWCCPIKGKFEIHICGIFALWILRVIFFIFIFYASLISDSWEETKSFLKLPRWFLIRLNMRFNVALFLDLGFGRHRSSEFLSACNNA